MQRVAHVLQCAAARYSVLQSESVGECLGVLRCVAACSSVLQSESIEECHSYTARYRETHNPHATQRAVCCLVSLTQRETATGPRETQPQRGDQQN